eukprot:TRINITY_DN1658_c0_g1_i3.p1 TRINITY_DN1658_c0_g1~~TRINITY_DN1658_c0_g1_i3.p1  ORF type:complete len:209 (+),score=34.15 TRINITY_DN1658_c0_g1_i3:44-628(+)
MADLQAGPLKQMAIAFKQLVDSRESTAVEADINVASFASACDYIGTFFGFLGVAFSFGGKDFTEKVQTIKDVAPKFSTLSGMVDADVKDGTVRTVNYPTRNLLRLKRGLDLIHRLFKSLLEDSSQPLRTCAWSAYEGVFAKHHGWAIQQAISAGTLLLPSKHYFLTSLKEDVRGFIRCCDRTCGAFICVTQPGP